MTISDRHYEDEPQFQVVDDEDLTPAQLRQVQAVRAENAASNPADADRPSPFPSGDRDDQ